MNQSLVSITEHDGIPMVSSHEVAKRFNRKHFHVLEAFDNLQAPESFKESNFRCTNVLDKQGISRRIIFMTKSGFSILAFGFTGERAVEWKIRFLEAFDSLQEAIPELQKRIAILEAEKSALLEAAQPRMLTASGKQPGATKNMVLVPVMVDTMFNGSAIRARRSLPSWPPCRSCS